MHSRDVIRLLLKDGWYQVAQAGSHKQFIAQYNLNFNLLADPEGKIADAYGVRMQGKNMAKRVSFLIGLDGKIAHVTDSSKPDVHFSEMKDAIAGLKKS